MTETEIDLPTLQIFDTCWYLWSFISFRNVFYVVRLVDFMMFPVIVVEGKIAVGSFGLMMCPRCLILMLCYSIRSCTKIKKK